MAFAGAESAYSLWLIPRGGFLWESLFEKRLSLVLNKLSVGACSVVIRMPCRAFRVHLEEKPALESEPTSMEAPECCDRLTETKVPEAVAGFQKLSCHHPYQS